MKRLNIENEIHRKKHNYPSFVNNLKEYFWDYSDNSSIHGVRYLGEKNRSILERLIWLIILVISLSFCMSSIVQLYIKWKASPNIVNFVKNPTPVWQIPFPAVTICAETKVKQRLFNFTDAFHKYLEGSENMTAEELKHYEQASLVCDSHICTTGNRTIGYDTIEYLGSLAPEFLWMCKWVNQNGSCEELMVPILTEEGFCYTFNMLNREELFTDVVSHSGEYLQNNYKAYNWTLETGYDKNVGIDVFPRRTMAAGQKGCFSSLMTLYEQDLDYICRGAVQGYKVFVHSPAEMPRVSQNYLRAPLNQEIVIQIEPNMMTTSESLRNYDPNIRQCYFAKERQLKYFRIYTQSNCEIECLTNYTLQRCGCVSFHMPHDEFTDLCGSGSTTCVHEAQEELLVSELESNIGTFQNEDYPSNTNSCNCLPSCTSVSYKTESSQADFNWQKVFMAYKADLDEFPGIQMTRLTIFFKEQQFIISERNELYGSADFLAKCGGLLALFIGFSFLSIIELFYFLTLRLFCNIKRYGRHFWSASSELLDDEDYEKEK